MFDELINDVVHKHLPGGFVARVLEEDLALNQSFECDASPKQIITFLLRDKSVQ